ncbi:glutathione S-transferase [Aquabacterium sp. J223]|uniref:glutathione S-transferase n=1 Tax=Aquabacterium sp. J223 TaxID=2898431 RepID=UPI0021ADF7BD|nr:glutathione S-transferase [Aquabacterium sp. J223]UUX96469.1 glutathione S-transferase [Aquabacterium sp. J223]
MKLFVGDRNLSSWSMRPWVLMRALGLAFDTEELRITPGLSEADRARLRALGGPARVPVLVLDDGAVAWDSLAIVETLAECFADRGVWPADARARAQARSLCAEMHSGFAALRGHCPMNIAATLPEMGECVWAANPAVREDLQRIDEAWRTALQAHGGPFLFGDRFGAADAYFAPVVSRVRSYRLPLSRPAAAYAERLWSTPAVQDWVQAAIASVQRPVDEG